MKIEFNETELVARIFSQLLAAQLTFDDLMEVCERNSLETNPAICHTHDFCDANELMISAVWAVTNDWEPSQNFQLIEAAWKLAKERCFYTGYLVEL